jgi:hypothetical protein
MAEVLQSDWLTTLDTIVPGRPASLVYAKTYIRGAIIEH